MSANPEFLSGSTAVVVYEQAKPKLGRPTAYTLELATRICQGLADGQSLRTVCKPDDMPSMASVYRWLHDHKEFRETYARAKDDAAEAMTEDILEISDNSSQDWEPVFNEFGVFVGIKGNKEHMMRSRLRVDTRKWIAAKLKPKKYGDTQRHEHTGEGGGPILLAPDRRAQLHKDILQLQGIAPKPDGDGK